MARYFNENLKFIRKKRNMSQQELADKLNLDRSTISRWEQGMDVTVENAIKVAEVLNIPIPDFLGKDLRIENPNEEIKEYNFGDVKVTISKNGKITDKDILETNQFLIQEKIKNENLDSK